MELIKYVPITVQLISSGLYINGLNEIILLSNQPYSNGIVFGTNLETGEYTYYKFEELKICKGKVILKSNEAED